MKIITLDQARKEGNSHYFTGKPCKNGHVSNRSVRGRSCLECSKEKRKRLYNANPEKFREKRKQSYIINVEKEKAIAKVKSAEWRKLNPKHEGTKIAKKKYKQNNIGKVNSATAKRRAAKLQRTPKWLTLDDKWMIEQAYELAVLRKKLFGFDWHVDHVIPLQGELVSGLHVPTNLQVIPGRENESKSNRYEL
jgi:hypothetical protein